MIAAANNPKMTCLKPEYQMLFPVKSVMAEPIKNKPTELEIALAIIAGVPPKKKNGNSGKIAPIANNTNEEIAASMAEPFSSSELIPNSSFTKTDVQNFCHS